MSFTPESDPQLEQNASLHPYPKGFESGSTGEESEDLSCAIA